MGDGKRLLGSTGIKNLPAEPMTLEEMAEEVSLLKEGRQLDLRFASKATSGDVARFNALTEAGHLKVNEPAMAIELKRVAAYSGDKSCWGTACQRSLSVTATDMFHSSSFWPLVSAFSHIMVID